MPSLFTTPMTTPTEKQAVKQELVEHTETISPTFADLTPEQEAKLWRKVDLRLMPILTLMYLYAFSPQHSPFPILTSWWRFSFLDRGCIAHSNPQIEVLILSMLGNIGNAKLQGLTTELKLDGNKYNIALVSQSVRVSRSYANTILSL